MGSASYFTEQLDQSHSCEGDSSSVKEQAVFDDAVAFNHCRSGLVDDGDHWDDSEYLLCVEWYGSIDWVLDHFDFPVADYHSSSSVPVDGIRA